VRAIVPVHSVEALPVRVVDPVMDGRLAHVELLGDLVLGATAADGGDDRLATQRLPVLLRLIATSGERCGFSVQDTAERSGSGGTRLIGIRWHMAPRPPWLGPLGGTEQSRTAETARTICRTLT
jgi:hypothetical protein